jgi:hypothetical protein
MKKDTRLNIAPGALLLILLGILILLAVHKRLTTAEEAEKAVVKVEHHVIRDSHSPVAIIAVVALFAYVNMDCPPCQPRGSQSEAAGQGVERERQGGRSARKNAGALTFGLRPVQLPREARRNS